MTTILECGCKMTASDAGAGVAWCPLHAAAPAMREALERAAGKGTQ
jgi:hypothetical protein